MGNRDWGEESGRHWRLAHRSDYGLNASLGSAILGTPTDYRGNPMAGRSNKQKKPVGFWQFLRDVALAGIAKGQGPTILLLLFLIVVASRMPADDLGEVGQDFVDLLKHWWFFGWILAGVLAVCWAIHAKSYRRLHFREMERVGTEKSQLQKQAADKQGKRIKSSKKK